MRGFFAPLRMTIVVGVSLPGRRRRRGRRRMPAIGLRMTRQEKNPVKAQVWDALLYRHWDHYTGEKRSHILVVDADGKNVQDLTPASAVGDAETPTWFLGGPLEYAWAPDSKRSRM